MKTYVLVHGAWHGGWCWRKLAHLLREAGFEVYTPTLTGLGERSHLTAPHVDLETHIQDVLGVLTYEDLTDVVLVGHSYAGVVVTTVADRALARLARLVYLDAVVPRNGQSLLDCVSAQVRSRVDEQVRREGQGWQVPPPTASYLGLVSDADVHWVMPKLVPQPYKTFQDAIRLDNPEGTSLSRTYINCIGDKPRGGAKSPQAEGMDYYELSTGHDAMVTSPRELADLLFTVV